MEDAHIAKINFYSNYSIFAIFDGHGGNNYLF